MSSEVVFAALVGILWLNDPISWRFFAGTLLIMGSVFGLNWIKAGGVETAKEPAILP